MIYNQEEYREKLETLDAERQAAKNADPAVSQAQSSLQSAQYTLAREQEKLEMTPRMLGNRHNQAIGRQTAVRDSAQYALEEAEKSLREAENTFARKQYE